MPVHPIQLTADSSPEECDRVTESAVRQCDQITGKAAVKLACREGCSLCCWLRVDVFAHEVFLIAHHIRAQFSAGEISELLVRLAAHSSQVTPLTPFEHATRNIPCPLLRDGRCSIYSVRPHSCRRHHSLDFAACQFTFDHPEDLASPAAMIGICSEPSPKSCSRTSRRMPGPALTTPSTNSARRCTRR